MAAQQRSKGSSAASVDTSKRRAERKSGTQLVEGHGRFQSSSMSEKGMYYVDILALATKRIASPSNLPG
jgi:hypothetical protein